MIAQEFWGFQTGSGKERNSSKIPGKHTSGAKAPFDFAGLMSGLKPGRTSPDVPAERALGSLFKASNFLAIRLLAFCVASKMAT
jgi:hypothetical protein